MDTDNVMEIDRVRGEGGAGLRWEKGEKKQKQL